jgi:predicted Zn-dependent protease
VAAAADLEVATADPDLGSQFRLRLAAVELSRGRNTAAADLLAGLLQDSPRDPAIRLLAAELALRRAEPARARDHARAALRARPGWEPARERLSRACRSCKCP